ncbi:hypothetical protein ES702_03500 [subsurface metagenome]
MTKIRLPELKILKERKKRNIQAKRKKERAKKKKEQDKKLKAQAKKQKHGIVPRKDGRLNRTKDYTATIYYLIMIFVGLVMLWVFLGGT